MPVLFYEGHYPFKRKFFSQGVKESEDKKRFNRMNRMIQDGDIEKQATERRKVSRKESKGDRMGNKRKEEEKVSRKARQDANKCFR